MFENPAFALPENNSEYAPAGVIIVSVLSSFIIITIVAFRFPTGEVYLIHERTDISTTTDGISHREKWNFFHLKEREREREEKNSHTRR